MGYVERKKEKLEEVYRLYRDDVYKVCLYFAKNEAAAQELTQQTFFKYYQHIDDAEIEATQGYLVRMARNLSFNYLRGNKLEAVKGSWDALAEDSAVVMSVEEAYFIGEEKRQKKELSASILERLKEENEQWYVAMNLIYCLGKPHDVVADELGISKDALYSLVYRARRWVYKNYNQRYEDIVKRS